MVNILANYSITFSILGNLDPSLLKALQGAADKIKSLGDLSKVISPKAVSQARALQRAASTLKALEGFNKLTGAMRTNQAALAANLLLASKQRAQQSAAVKQLDDMKAAYQRLNGVYKANRRSMGAEAATVMREQLKAARAELKAQQRLVDDYGKQSVASSTKAAKLRETLAHQQNQLTQMRSTLPAGINTSAEAALRAQIQATTAALNQEIAALERRNQVFANFSQANADLSNAWSNFQASLSTAQTILNPFKDAADNAEEFEFAMSRVKALTQMRNLKEGDFARVEREMAALTEQAQALGAATEFTKTEAAQAMGYLGMAGWDTSRIQAGMKPILDLASIAGDHNIQRTADVFSDLMTAMSLKPGQMLQIGDKQVEAAQHFGDAMAYALTQSNMNRENFFEALKYSAPIAATAGLTVGEEIAANMIVANSGLKGSMAGTGMRSGLLTLAGANKKAQAALEEVGVSSSDAQRQMAEAQDTFNALGVTGSSFSQRVMQLGEAFSKMSGDERLTNAYKIFGKNAATFWTKLLSDPESLKQFAQYAEEIDSGYATGWAGETAAVMRDNTKTAIEYLKSALDALEGNAGAALLPALRGAAEAFTPLVTSAAQWVAQHPQIVQACAAVAAALATATVAVAGFSLAMAGVRFAQAGFATARLLLTDLATKAAAATTALRGLTLASIGSSLSSGLTAAATAMRTFSAATLAAGRAALAFIATPVGAVLAAVALAGLWAYENWDKVSAALSRIGDALSGVISPALDAAGKAFGGLATALSPLGDVIGTLTNAVGGTLVGAFIGLGGAVASIIAGILVGLAGLIKTVAELGSGIAQALGQIGKGDFSGAFETLSAAGAQAAKNYEAAWRDATGAVEKGLAATAQAMRDLTAPSLPTAQVTARHRVDFDESGAAHSAPVDVSNVQRVDTSALQSSIDNASASMGQVPAPAQLMATSLEGVNNPAQTLSMSLMAASPATQALAFSAQTAAASSDALGWSATGATGGIDALSWSAAGSTGSIDAMSSSASSASGFLGGLGAAASSAVSALYGAAASAAGVISAAASSAWTSIKGAVGLIGGGGGGFARGGFVDSTTTFYAGEHGREVIIPLTEHHQRAVGLWQSAGRMLGISNQAAPGLRLSAPNDQSPPINVSISVTINGNADESTVRRGLESALPTLQRSFADELAAYRREQRRRSFA